LITSAGELSYDLLVIATGARPREPMIEGKENLMPLRTLRDAEKIKELALKSGIHAGRGILIDDRFRTSAQDVYAIGDCAEYNGIICGTAKGAMGHARVLANLIRGEEDRYAFEFRSTLFKFGDFPIAIIGETKGNGNWLDNKTKVFFKEGKVVGAVIIKDVKKALELERKIKSRVSIDEL